VRHYINVWNGFFVSTPPLCNSYIVTFAIIGWCGVSVEVHLSPLALWVLVESSFIGLLYGRVG